MKSNSIDGDPLAVRPIIEALIFASEEPLSARTLIRLLSGEHARERVPSLFDVNAIDEESIEPAESEGRDLPAETGLSEQGEDDDQAAGDISSREEADDLADAMERAKARTGGKLASDSDADSIDQRYIRRMIEYLNQDYDETNRAFRIVEVAGGFQFATIREYGSYVALLSKEKGRRRLSPAALETLAIIAYRQPVSKPEIEGIRGVNCDQVLLNLMEKNLVAMVGRSEGVGRPLLYGTSDDFLRVFGLNNITDLPKLREIEELMEEGALSASTAEILMIGEESDAEEIEARLGAMGQRSEEEEASAGGEESTGGENEMGAEVQEEMEDHLEPNIESEEELQ